jgi:hypothetical protein
VTDLDALESRFRGDGLPHRGDARRGAARLAASGERIEITEALPRVAGGIGAFAGLYYAIAVLTDSTYREEFLDELTDEM